jgi:class 3 adenylate cyclase/tRNA A-37 threonylcarbamoyl transferase component Bud32
LDAEEFGRYRLLESIGQGGMGQVFRAHDAVLARNVAIKVLRSDLANEPGFRERFRREARAAARLSEPHIIPIYDSGEIDGRLYLVMPIIDGTDLGTLLKREGPMSPSRAVRVIDQVAAALDAAHTHGLLHRDVKPSNALMADHEFVYLIDFGIAQDTAATKLTTSGAILGTFAYMAPERVTTEISGASADIYALACVLYECLTGEQPYAGDSAEQQIAAHLYLEPPQPSVLRPGVPIGFDEVIARGMAKKPDQRYESAGDLAFAAEGALATPPRDHAAGASHRSQVATLTASPAELLADQVNQPAPPTEPPLVPANAAAACRMCGAEPLENARFCHGCGSPVTEQDIHAEYKQVTVLFADMVRSMDIAATLGAERLREIMADLVDHASRVVQRYGGTVDKFTGDGIMALFGAPVALEDHALRACRAALEIHSDISDLAQKVSRRDGVELQLRIGLNSGQVITGEIGSGALGYTAIGEQVGMARRMESVAPPGGVMLSKSTARLVEGAATLGEVELVQIKGADAPVVAHRLLGMAQEHHGVRRAESYLVGRRWEMSAIESLLDRAVDGQGAVLGVMGPPGIGKSRLAREVAAMAAARGVDVFTAFCESHARDIPFYVVARLLRAAFRVADLDASAARAQVRARVPDAEPEDLLLFDDLLGIADAAVALPKIAPDARRRRLTALVNAAAMGRERPAVYVVEDVHWIDEVSESMIAEFLTVIPQTPSLVLVTYRPEYEGALVRVHRAQTIALAPLSDAETNALVSQLLGPDPSVGGLATMIAERAAGNPFFAEEMVRELAERGVLQGQTGAYVSTADVSEARVPATLQATIAARIDRLDPKAKRTLSAAAVIGSRFSLNLLETLGIDPALEDLVASELIDQIRFTGQPEYVFHHPLIRTVAYEAQLKSDRAELHRRVAAAIETRDPATVEENAALIAEHLESAGDLHAAYGWHMRAAAWASNRDIAAARLSWERAVKIAEALPEADPGRAALRIGPRTMLCGTAWRVHDHAARDRFDELRQLCAAAGDKASLAIAMAGLVVDHAYQDRIHEASRLASEAWALIESVGDPTLTVGLSMPVIYAKGESGEWREVLRWSQRAIDLADGDPSKGNFLFGSPLATAFAARAVARYFLGRPGWRDDLRHGLAMARSVDPLSYATAVCFVYFSGIPHGVLTPDDPAMGEIEDALRIAERSGDDLAVVIAQMTLSVALVHRPTDADRDRGQTLLTEVSDVLPRRGHNLGDLPLVNVCVARERARRGDRDAVIPLMRAAADHLLCEGQLLLWGIPATGVLVETLLDRGDESDVAEAEAAIERLAAAPADDGLVMRDIWLLRLRALLARAHGDAAAYADFRDRYRAMARTLGFEGHIAWAEAMP